MCVIGCSGLWAPNACVKKCHAHLKNERLCPCTRHRTAAFDWTGLRIGGSTLQTTARTLRAWLPIDDITKTFLLDFARDLIIRQRLPNVVVDTTFRNKLSIHNYPLNNSSALLQTLSTSIAKNVAISTDQVVCDCDSFRISCTKKCWNFTWWIIAWSTNKKMCTFAHSKRRYVCDTARYSYEIVCITE